MYGFGQVNMGVRTASTSTMAPPGPGTEPPPLPLPPEPGEEEDHKGALLWGGILVVVLAVGGYALYRGSKKR